jgi:preprotein translocase subunit SecG
MDIFFTVLLILVALGLIATVLLQSGKSAGLSGSIGGGAEQLFGKQKARGMDALLEKLTVILAISFIILSVVVAFLAL